MIQQHMHLTNTTHCKSWQQGISIKALYHICHCY